MNYTKHDLSANHVKLDYKALVRTASIACNKSMEEVGRYLNRMRELGRGENNTAFYCDAAWLASEAQGLAIAAETYITLIEAERRSEIEVINRLEVKED